MRRCFYEPGTAPAQGVQWEWESSTGAWTTYDMEASIAIHKAHSRQQAGLDLEPLGLAQLIDFSTMTQVRVVGVMRGGGVAASVTLSVV